MKADDEKQIDIVIAWVDGDEPLLKQKRARYQKTTSAASDAISSTRFASNDEIYYNIASIRNTYLSVDISISSPTNSNRH